MISGRANAQPRRLMAFMIDSYFLSDARIDKRGLIPASSRLDQSLPQSTLTVFSTTLGALAESPRLPWPHSRTVLAALTRAVAAASSSCITAVSALNASHVRRLAILRLLLLRIGRLRSGFGGQHRVAIFYGRANWVKRKGPHATGARPHLIISGL